jgi:hypothetical protein
MKKSDCYIKTPRKTRVYNFIKETRDLDIQIPIINGYTSGKYLLIKHCPLCNRRHIHSNDNYPKGYLTARTVHCGISGNEYIIKVVGRINESTFLKFSERITPFRTKIDAAGYISCRDYLEYCEERESYY